MSSRVTICWALQKEIDTSRISENNNLLILLRYLINEHSIETVQVIFTKVSAVGNGVIRMVFIGSPKILIAKGSGNFTGSFTTL